MHTVRGCHATCRRFLGLLVSSLSEWMISSSGTLKWVQLELLGKGLWNVDSFHLSFGLVCLTEGRFKLSSTLQ